LIGSNAGDGERIMLGRYLSIELMFVRNLDKLFPLRLVARIWRQGPVRLGRSGSSVADAGRRIAPGRGLSQSFTATKENGMPLGLSISHEIVGTHEREPSAAPRCSGDMFRIALPTSLKEDGGDGG
jgi:hypothetical protein